MQDNGQGSPEVNTHFLSLKKDCARKNSDIAEPTLLTEEET